MKVVNDNPKSNPAQHQVAMGSFVYYSILITFGFLTLIFSPLPIILTNQRLPLLWARASTLMGAIFAIIFFDAPVFLVVISFSYGLVAAELIGKGLRLRYLVPQVFGVVLLIAGLLLAVSAERYHISFGQVVTQGVAQIISEIKKNNMINGHPLLVLSGIDLSYELPFLVLTSFILSLWLSIGIASHFAWFPVGHRYHSDQIRRCSNSSSWFSVGFSALFILTIFSKNAIIHLWCPGVLKVLSAFLFIRGSISLSILLAHKQLSMMMRTVFYGVSIVFAFYAILALGIISPWLFNNSKSYKDRSR